MISAETDGLLNQQARLAATSRSTILERALLAYSMTTQPDLPPQSDPTLNQITLREAQNFLRMAKEAYVRTMTKDAGPLLVAQYRVEMRYWEDFIWTNWPEVVETNRPQPGLVGHKHEPWRERNAATEETTQQPPPGDSTLAAQE